MFARAFECSSNTNSRWIVQNDQIVFEHFVEETSSAAWIMMKVAGSFSN